MKQQKIKTSNLKVLSGEEFDEKFDKGEKLDNYIDWNRAEKLVNVTFPVWMINALDKEATRLGINRQALIKIWIAEKIEHLTGK